MKQKTNPGSTHGITLSLLRLYHSIQQEHDAMSPSQEKNPMKQKENQMRYYLGEKYPNIYLSLREAQCVALCLDGCANHEIAKRLNLSQRTVEFYFNNIKVKLDAKSKKQILDIMRQTNFMQQIATIRNNLQKR